MSQTQRTFEALMRTKNYTDFSQIKGRYINPSLQVRWNYFQMGWEMRGVTA